MNLRYVGPYPSVDVPAGFGVATVAQGEVFEFDDELAAGLLEQADNWQLAEGKPAKKATAKPAEDKPAEATTTD